MTDRARPLSKARSMPLGDADAPPRKRRHEPSYVCGADCRSAVEREVVDDNSAVTHPTPRMSSEASGERPRLNPRQLRPMRRRPDREA